MPEAGSRASESVLQGEDIMFPWTYQIKFYKGDSIVTMTVKALTEMSALEQLGITRDQVIEIRMMDGI